MPYAVLKVLAAKADRVLAARALAMLPATTAAFASEKEQHRVVAELERRAGRGRRGSQKRIPLQDTSVATIAKVLGMTNGSR